MIYGRDQHPRDCHEGGIADASVSLSHCAGYGSGLEPTPMKSEWNSNASWAGWMAQDGCQKVVKSFNVPVFLRNYSLRGPTLEQHKRIFLYKNLQPLNRCAP